MGAKDHISDLDKRLATIEGHIKGVRQMVANDKCCEDVLLQLKAIKGSLDSLSKQLLIKHATECVKVDDQDEQAYSKFIDVLNKYV